MGFAPLNVIVVSSYRWQFRIAVARVAIRGGQQATTGRIGAHQPNADDPVAEGQWDPLFPESTLE
ncbi:hypothetical protein GCM10010452_02740 [Crossiella cryophila]